MADVKEPEIVNIEPKTVIEKQTLENVIDGRIFEADREVVLTDEERVEMEEFNKAVKKYNAISKQQFKNAIEEEKEELLQGKIKEVSGYFDGTIVDRIKMLDTEYKLMEDIDKKIERKMKQ